MLLLLGPVARPDPAHTRPCFRIALAMLNIFARASVSRLIEPVGGWLFRAGVSPDAITFTGTIGTVASSLWFFPRGQLLIGTIAVTVFVLLDVLDGAVARARGSGTPYGTVLDATCDRVADGAVFAGLTWWCFGVGQRSTAGCGGVVLFGERPGHLLHQGSRRSHRSGRGWRDGGARGAFHHRVAGGRAGRARRALRPRRRVVAARRVATGDRGTTDGLRATQRLSSERRREQARWSRVRGRMAVAAFRTRRPGRPGVPSRCRPSRASGWPRNLPVTPEPGPSGAPCHPGGTRRVGPRRAALLRPVLAGGLHAAMG